MSNKQFLAKVGVFALLGVNIGAYYIFWPHHDGRAKSEANAPKGEKGEAQLLPAAPAKQPSLERPKEIPAGSLTDAVPLSIPNPPKKEAKDSTPDELAAKLLEHIRRERESSNPPVVIIPSPMPRAFDEKKFVAPEKPEVPAPPLFPGDGKPRMLPDLKGDPMHPDNVGVTSPLTPKNAPSAWNFKTEIAGAQTLLIAKVQEHVSKTAPVEFRILCDRLETKPGNSEVVAEGTVTISGNGQQVTCQRVTLPLHEPRLIFDGRVRIVHSNAPGMLQAEHVEWNLHVGVTVSNPGVLGPPK